MRIIAIIDDEDCGPFAILDEDAISVIKCSDFYIAATVSAYTGRPITCEISNQCAEKLIENGVRCLDFNDEITSTKEVTENKKLD